VITIRTTERNGKVVSVNPIADDDHIILTTVQGNVIRTRAGRSVPWVAPRRGSPFMGLSNGDKITAVARLCRGRGAAEGGPDRVQGG
jgi:DNA gyrase subunit A